MSRNKRQDQKDYFVPDRSDDALLKDTTVQEKFRVFEISKRINKYLSGLLFATGGVSTLMSAQYFLGARIILASEFETLFLLVLGFIGVANVASGLLLLAKE